MRRGIVHFSGKISHRDLNLVAVRLGTKLITNLWDTGKAITNHDPKISRSILFLWIQRPCGVTGDLQSTYFGKILKQRIVIVEEKD